MQHELKELTASEDRQKTRSVMTFQNLAQTVVILGAIVFSYTHLQSDTRDNTTRIEQHERDIVDIRTVQQRNQDENQRLLRDLDSKVDRMLGRLEAKTTPIP